MTEDECSVILNMCEEGNHYYKCDLQIDRTLIQEE
jgi:hypothetical protein